VKEESSIIYRKNTKFFRVEKTLIKKNLFKFFSDICLINKNNSTDNINFQLDILMMIDLVKRPVLTEKTIRLIENNQYTFDVDSRLKKPQIKSLIESTFNVTVVGLNTHRPPRKKRRLGFSQGYRSTYKRVIVTVKTGQMIPLISEEQSGN
jgi:large subunit ribosomal protein L23